MTEKNDNKEEGKDAKVAEPVEKAVKPGPKKAGKPGPKKGYKHGPKKGVVFKYTGKGAGRYDGKEFHPYPEFGTVMIPAAEGEQRVEVGKGGTVTITDPETIARLNKNPKWERVKK